MRATAFVGVGALGFVVQMAALASLLAAGWPYLPATAISVELAVVHNFLWPERSTWADRIGRQYGVAGPPVGFHVATGSTSIAGSLALTVIYVIWLGLGPLAANALAVASMAVANYLIADRWVFSGRGLTTLNTEPTELTANTSG